MLKMLPGEKNDMLKNCNYCKKEFKTNRSARLYCGYSCSNAATAQKREAEKLKGQPVQVWSCGGGVDSVAIAALICSGKLPKPDLALMTDCGYEKESTLNYVNNIVIPELSKSGIILNIVKTTDFVSNEIIRNGYVMIPAFHHDGKKIKRFKNACNLRWKVHVAYKWIRSQGVKHCHNWIGYAADEARRVGPSGRRWLKQVYPLIDLGLSRSDCIEVIKAQGWPVPERSACFMCPQQTDQSWLNMKRERPTEWKRAIEIEQEIQHVKPGVYLRKSLRPLSVG